MKKSHDGDLTFEDLYPELTGSELREAQYNLERYLEVMLKIYQQLELDPEAHERFRRLKAAEPTIDWGEE